MRSLFFLSPLYWTSAVFASVSIQPDFGLDSLLPSLYPRDECGIPPPELQMNRSGQFPDGSYGCTISPDDPDPYGAQKQCEATCAPDLVGSQEGVGPAIVCLAANWPEDHPCTGQLIKSQDVTLGRCLCGAPVIEYLVKEVVVALPKIAAVGCFVFFGALEAVAEWTAKITRTDVFFEGIGALVEGFSSISIEAPTDFDVIPMIFDWLTQNACDSSSLSYDLQSEIEKTFGTIVDFGKDRNFNTGPRRPKNRDEDTPTSESAAPGLSPAPTPSPTDSVLSQTQSSLDTTFTTSSTPAPACGLVKRARQTGKATWTSCDNNGDIHSTVVTTMKFGIAESTFTTTCSKTWNHACAHYSSVVDNNPRWEAMKCRDELGVPRVDHKRVITGEWNKQHHAGWVNEKYRVETDCERDEWPPVYWFPPGDPVLTNLEQVVRYLPGQQNRGAQAMWRSFCWSRGLSAADNQVQLEQKNQADNSQSQKGKDGKMTTTYTTSISMSAHYKPVFSIASYELDGLDPNTYGLSENPCIPVGISNDFLFPLLRTDPAVNNGADWIHDYAQPPDPQVLAQAVDVRA